MASDPDNLGLVLSFNHKLIFEILSDFDSCFDTIHDWHVKVGEDKHILHATLVCFLQLFECLLASDTVVDLIVHVDALAEKDGSHCRETEFLIIDDHDAALAILLEKHVRLHSLVQSITFLLLLLRLFLFADFELLAVVVFNFKDLQLGKVRRHLADHLRNFLHLHLVVGFHLERVKERGAFAVLGKEIDVAIELVNDQLADNQSQTDAVGVKLLLLILDGPE
jgi:hypothetical protein